MTIADAAPEIPTPKFSLPSDTNMDLAQLRLYKKQWQGRLTWWRLSIENPHPGDIFGVEFIDTNGDYRRAKMGALDLETFPSLSEEIYFIATAHPWMLTDAEYRQWADGQDPSGLFLLKAERWQKAQED